MAVVVDIPPPPPIPFIVTPDDIVNVFPGWIVRVPPIVVFPPIIVFPFINSRPFNDASPDIIVFSVDVPTII